MKINCWEVCFPKSNIPIGIVFFSQTIHKTFPKGNQNGIKWSHKNQLLGGHFPKSNILIGIVFFSQTIHKTFPKGNQNGIKWLHENQLLGGLFSKTNIPIGNVVSYVIPPISR